MEPRAGKSILFGACALSVCLAAPLATAASFEAEVVAGNNAFAVGLYGQLRNQPGNLFFSPESISTALAMTYAGARGDTATEMAAALHFTLPPANLHATMGALLRTHNAAHQGYQLKEADALWAQRDFAFSADFLKLTGDDYGAGINQVDFEGAAEAARETINRWVEERTENKIKDLIAPGLLKPDTRLVLTNAIYFRSAWRTPFEPDETKNGDFHVSAARTVTVPLMHRDGRFDYFAGDAFQALAIPYVNDEMSMVIFLPKAPAGLAGYEETPTPEKMRQWLGQLRPSPEVIVTLPRFTVAAKFRLNETLQAMGMKRAFDRDRADLSGMTGKTELYLSSVIHQAFVEINETGTEAAAATAVTIDRATARAMPTEPPAVIFRADHPFMFLIRDNRTDAILFMGRVTDPSA